MTAKDNKIMTPVKIGLPSLVVYADHLHISSLLLNNTDSAFPSVVVEYVEFTDVFGQKSAVRAFIFLLQAHPTLSTAISPLKKNLI